VKYEDLILRSLNFISRHWLLFLNGIIALFLLPVFLAPALSASGWPEPAGAIYSLYHRTCHQYDYRSDFIFGYKIAICSRCEFIYLSFWAFTMMFALVRRYLRALPIVWLVILSLPMAVDAGAQFLGIPRPAVLSSGYAPYESTNWLRALTGGSAGVAWAYFVLPYLEIAFRQVEEATRVTAKKGVVRAPEGFV